MNLWHANTAEVLQVDSYLVKKKTVPTACMKAEFGKEWVHVYGWLRPFGVHLKLSQDC